MRAKVRRLVTVMTMMWAVMGELPVAGEAAHQQAVDPGAEDAAAEGEPPAAVPDAVLNPSCHLTEAVVALHVLCLKLANLILNY